jgi:hypothetical protein
MDEEQKLITVEQAAWEEARAEYPDTEWTRPGTQRVIHEAYVRGRLKGIPGPVQQMLIRKG